MAVNSHPRAIAVADRVQHPGTGAVDAARARRSCGKLARCVPHAGCCWPCSLASAQAQVWSPAVLSRPAPRPARPAFAATTRAAPQSVTPAG